MSAHAGAGTRAGVLAAHGVSGTVHRVFSAKVSMASVNTKHLGPFEMSPATDGTPHREPGIGAAVENVLGDRDYHFVATVAVQVS